MVYRGNVRSVLLTVSVPLVVLSANAFPDPVPVEYDTVKTYPDMYVEGGTPERNRR